MEDKAREAAYKAVRDLGEDPDTYTLQATEESSIWRFTFLPKQRGLRGGGFEIAVAKQTYKVNEILRYQ
ncbi:MAG: hypothetical protein HGA65_08345 [Oscillochloris sp.]|nr:hypothetical protein [Oscillochloris sp.]